MTSPSPDEQTSALPSAVLLVEDNPIIAMNTEALLLDMGVANVEVAGTVAEALALIENGQFDLGLLDLKLGDNETSLPIAERLNADGVRIIFASGFGEEISLPDGHGEHRMLRKPYSYADLERAVSVSAA